MRYKGLQRNRGRRLRALLVAVMRLALSVILPCAQADGDALANAAYHPANVGGVHCARFAHCGGEI